MNIFYAPPAQITGQRIELLDQEARHAHKVLRYREGDAITVVDGCGGWYEGQVARILRDSVQIEVQRHITREQPDPELVMAFGIIKKRDRLEFAVEKAVELGASELILFRSEHTIKENIRRDRLESTARSAMKQSLRAYLPSISVANSLSDVINGFQNHQLLVAQAKQDDNVDLTDVINEDSTYVLLVGPEGGFSDGEMADLLDHGAEVVSLGPNRLRTETAVVAFLSQFLSLRSPRD